MLIINNEIRFGPSGNDDSFYEQGYKTSLDMPKWLHDKGLNAYEYSLTRGIRLKEQTARDIGEQAAKWGISMSVHAPYYINLASDNEEGRQKSIQYLYRSAEAASWFGATRVVFHPGSATQNRELALDMAKMVLLQALEECGHFISKGIHLCPETMGKRNQLGNLEEVLELCQMDSSLIPTIDFGHLHALHQGIIQTSKDYINILNPIEEALGPSRSKSFHIHFSRIEYTNAGEKKHHTYQDTEYGPDFDPLAVLIVDRDLKPVIISESRGKMAQDAVVLKSIYDKEYNKK